MRTLAFATIGLLLAATVTTATAKDFELTITATEPAGVARSAEPVCGGVPLPAGLFDAGQSFALFEGDKEIPLQATPIVLDAAGKKVRWLLLDFQADFKANEKKTFSLRAVKPSAKPATPLKLTDTADAVTIETGRAKLAISKSKPFGLFAAASADGKPVVAGGQVRYTDAFDGKTYAAGAPASVAVEYNGPVRATVCVKGRFVGDDKNAFQYVARITAWAGSTRVAVKYSLANSNEQHYCYRQVADSSIELKLAGAVEKVVLGGGKPIEAGKAGWLHQGLWASVAGNAKAGSGEKELWSSAGRDDRAGGWLSANAGAAGLYVCDLYFADDPARRLAAAGDAVTLTGVAQRYDGVKDSRGRTAGQPYSAQNRVIMDCTHLASQYVLDLAPAGDGAGLAVAARGRLHAMAPPSWYSDTESLAFGHFGTLADELKCYDTWGWKYDPKRVPHDVGRHNSRFISHQDVHFDFEEDIVEAQLMLYLRSGDRAYFNSLEPWANYWTDTYAWRTDGWRYKDGGVWWPKSKGGPLGNRPQRPGDPETGIRNYLSTPKVGPEPKPMRWDLQYLAMDKCCYCHNWAAGLAGWFCITGDRDALEACIDLVEQHIDTQRRAFGVTPDKTDSFSRQFTRSSYLAHAVRMVVPADAFVAEASDYLAKVYFDRPTPEPRGLVDGATPLNLKWCNGDPQVVENWFKGFVGEQGIAEMKRLGVTINPADGKLTDPKSGASWYPIAGPHSWMLPPLSKAMDLYQRLTGDERARDWTIVYGQGAASVIYQPRHGNLYYGRLMVDFPLKGVSKDLLSWTLPADANQYGEGSKISGYLARFHPDVPARGYSLCGEPLLKQRAYDFWFHGSHRGYWATQMHDLGGVGLWVNYYGPHSESVTFTSRMFYEFSHPRADAKAPAAVADLAVSLDGTTAKVSFTAPADEGGGKVARYQLKCSDKPIVEYAAFLKDFAASKDGAVTNWWMAANLAGEPAPAAAGQKVTFTVSDVPAGAKYFALRSFDDSANRSALGGVAEAK